ncbi:MAG: hypothetical protein OEM78_04315 [Gammaproteobacteria bacterium]|nr:hypothetical protein [Gammaproteobacteria bacterium]
MAVLLAHGFVGWALCGAIMFIALRRTTAERALVIHAAGAPVVFAFLSVSYFSVFDFTSPLVTATTFAAVVVVMDVGIVAPFIEKSYAMFRSVLGTWIPFGLIFVVTLSVGALMSRSSGSALSEACNYDCEVCVAGVLDQQSERTGSPGYPRWFGGARGCLRVARYQL